MYIVCTYCHKVCIIKTDTENYCCNLSNVDWLQQDIQYNKIVFYQTVQLIIN